MATYNEIVEKVNQYLDPQECNRNSVIEYLYSHRYVTSDVFVLAYNQNNKMDMVSRRRYRFQRFSPILDESSGFYETEIDTFLKRMPFYFYQNDEFGYHSFAELAFMYSNFFEFVNDKQDARMRRDLSEDEWEPLYEMLEEMYYNFRLSLDDIFGYVSTQTHSITRFDIFDKWYKYLKLEEKLNDFSDLTPKNILYSLNKALEASGKTPIIYKPDYDDGGEGFMRDKGEITVEGDFPINPETGEVERRWIGIWAENIKYIKAVPCGDFGLSTKKEKEVNSIHCLLNIGLLPDTILYFNDYESLKEEDLTDELKDVDKKDITVWTPIYIGPLLLKFDFNKIKERREDYKYTQQQAAERVGAKVRTYQNWEAKTTLPDAESLIRLMNLFDINNVQDLMTTHKVIDVKYKKFLSGGNISLFLPRDEE